MAALQRRAADQPEDIVLQGSETSVSAAMLVLQLDVLAVNLRSLGVGMVGLYADNSPAWAMIDLACQFESVCLVPIPTFFSTAQIEHLLTSAGIDTLIYDTKLSAALPPGVHTDGEPLPEMAGLSVSRLQPTTTPCLPPNTTKVTFTSGSTGVPKGVCLSFEQCLSVADSLAGAIGVNYPRHLSVLPLSTLLENIGGIYMPLLAGGESIVVSPAQLGMSGSSGLDSKAFLAALLRYQPNTLILVPQLLAVLDAALESGWQPPESLAFVAVGGARVSPTIVHRVRARGLPVYEGYGLSECASVVSLNSPAHDRPGSSGRVLPHVRVHVGNGEGESEGEIEVSGNAFLGYLDQPASWDMPSVATGDIGSIDEDGYVTINGRSKNMIISSFGRNISPEWVESELMAGNRFAQVIVLGDSRPMCVALVLPVKADALECEIQAEIDRANAGLPDYARVGRWLCLSEPLSASNGLLTDNGRPRREKIEEQYAQKIDQLYTIIKESVAL
jgi:long-chain acyl-CoA synthetase